VKNLPQGHELIRFGHGFPGVLVQGEIGPFPVQIHGKIFKSFLLPALFSHIFHRELKILQRHSHGTAPGAHMVVTGPQDAFGPLLSGPLGPQVIDELGMLSFMGHAS
jgi:hypothetical protein